MTAPTLVVMQKDVEVYEMKEDTIEMPTMTIEKKPAEKKTVKTAAEEKKTTKKAPVKKPAKKQQSKPVKKDTPSKPKK